MIFLNGYLELKAHQGTSFQRLKDECKRATAVRYLASTELTFSEVSHLLGFDEISTFFEYSDDGLALLHRSIGIARGQ
ncbi:MAG: AraC-like DNA-binding protein [Granulosicoccus sp.]|jgi:AraC-like DNA-binding protein